MNVPDTYRYNKSMVSDEMNVQGITDRSTRMNRIIANANELNKASCKNKKVGQFASMYKNQTAQATR